MNITYIRDSTTKAGGKHIQVKDVFTVPSLSKNLISVKRMCDDNNVSVNFNSNKV